MSVKSDIEEHFEKEVIKLEEEMLIKKMQLKQMIINNISDLQFKIANSLKRSVKHLSTTKYFLEHRHENHKHASYEGHRYDACSNKIIKSGWKFRQCNKLGTIGSGTYFPYKVHLIDILFLEMNNSQDLDGNGLIFFKDFVIDLKQGVPAKLKSMSLAYWYPGSALYPYFDKNGDEIVVGTDYISYLNSMTGNLSHFKREKKCEIISWNDYLKTVSTCYGGLKEDNGD